MRTVVSQWEGAKRVPNRIDFRAGSLSGHAYTLTDKYGKIVEVYSVVHWSTEIVKYYDGIWYFNDTRYSPTTSKHQSNIRNQFNYDLWAYRSIHFTGLRFGVCGLHQLVTPDMRVSRIKGLANVG